MPPEKRRQKLAFCTASLARLGWDCRSAGVFETEIHLFSIVCLRRISETDSGYVRLGTDLIHCL